MVVNVASSQYQLMSLSLSTNCLSSHYTSLQDYSLIFILNLHLSDSNLVLWHCKPVISEILNLENGDGEKLLCIKDVNNQRKGGHQQEHQLKARKNISQAIPDYP